MLGQIVNAFGCIKRAARQQSQKLNGYCGGRASIHKSIHAGNHVQRRYYQQSAHFSYLQVMGDRKCARDSLHEFEAISLKDLVQVNQ